MCKGEILNEVFLIVMIFFVEEGFVIIFEDVLEVLLFLFRLLFLGERKFRIIKCFLNKFEINYKIVFYILLLM